MKKKLLPLFAVCAAGAIALSACMANDDNRWSASDIFGDPSENGSYYPQFEEMFNSAGSFNGENFRYESIVEQGFHETAKAPSSYFSLDRNTASYSQVRAQLMSGRQIASDSVRAEELINYFSYSFPAPEDGEEVRATAYLSDCPWNEENKLVTVGIRTQEREIEAEFNNYVLLVDVSGSMSSHVQGLEGTTVMDLVKYGAEKLVSGLSDSDYVSIVTYASGIEVKLEPTRADEKGKSDIIKAIEKLNAYGSTNGSGGLQLAYEQAQKHFSEEGNNRVILMTDGDFNVGIYDADQLKEFVQEKAKSGIYLSVLGFGMGNMRDDFMQTLALNGNGNYAYIDTPAEAEKVLSKELAGMLVPVAKDAKAGVTFDAELVSRYRLIGYDMKIMSESDFNNSEKDAGEIGSNLNVVALYEIELAEGVSEGEALAEVIVRYKSAGESEEDREITETVRNTVSQNEDVAFIACVAEFSLVIRKSEYRGNSSLSAVLSRLKDMPTYLDSDPYKTEFQRLVEIAQKAGYDGI